MEQTKGIRFAAISETKPIYGSICDRSDGEGGNALSISMINPPKFGGGLME